MKTFTDNEGNKYQAIHEPLNRNTYIIEPLAKPVEESVCYYTLDLNNLDGLEKTEPLFSGKLEAKQATALAAAIQALVEFTQTHPSINTTRLEEAAENARDVMQQDQL